MNKLKIEVIAGNDGRVYIYWKDKNNNIKYIGYYDEDFIGKEIEFSLHNTEKIDIIEKKGE